MVKIVEFKVDDSYPDLFLRIKTIAKARRIPIHKLANEYLRIGLLVDAELEEIKNLHFNEEESKKALDNLIKRQAFRKRVKELKDETT